MCNTHTQKVGEYLQRLKEAGLGSLPGKFLKRQPATNATTQYAYRADFWEIPYKYERNNTAEIEEHVNHVKKQD